MPITTEDDGANFNHRIVVVYVDGHDGIYMDSSGAASFDKVQKVLTKTYGLPPVAPPACGRAVQGYDGLCVQWSNVLAFLVDAGFTPESAADFLYDTGVLGLQAYAAMVGDSDAINDEIVDPSIPGRLAPWPIKAGEDAWRFRLVPGDSPGWAAGRAGLRLCSTRCTGRRGWSSCAGRAGCTWWNGVRAAAPLPGGGTPLGRRASPPGRGK